MNAAGVRRTGRARVGERLAYRVGEAAQVLGVSADFFAVHVAPELRWVRRGAVKLVSRHELEHWLERSGERILDDGDEAA